MKFDVLCFGSATCDIYIKSPDFKLKEEGDERWLCQLYGSKVGVESMVIATGGGATNVGVCMERMGFQAAVIACVGNDYWGKVAKAKLKEEGVSLVHLQTTNKMETSTSIVLVGKDGGRTIMVYRAASNLLSKKEVAWDSLNAKWIYTSSLGGDLDFLEKIVQLAKGKNIKLAFNPGGLELKKRKELKQLLMFVDLLIVNKEEMETLMKGEEFNKNDLGKLGVKMLIVTDGDKGASLFLENGREIKQKAIKGKVVESTGAGDAFGSGFLTGILRELSFEDSLKLAAYNAKSVVGAIGPKEGLLFWPEARKLLKI